MSDHQYYCDSIANEINIGIQDTENLSDNFENDKERSGDDFLIELYRERPYLYDKRNNNFKDTLMKQNAWNEISKTMIETNCGDFYTPEYCQRRCTSLREQFNREKKRQENESRSGSAASNSKSRPFALYSKLTFLDQVIKRRRSYTNVQKCQSDATLVNKSVLGSEVPDDVSTCSYNKENEGEKNQETVDSRNLHPKVTICSPSRKKGKINETKALEQTFMNMSSRIMNYMENSKPLTADEAFLQFIKA